jgi:hypothetical protein
MGQYSLDEQYRIFRSGSDNFEPPVLGLARPIAARGKTVIPFLFGKLRPQPSDVTGKGRVNTVRDYERHKVIRCKVGSGRHGCAALRRFSNERRRMEEGQLTDAPKD